MNKTVVEYISYNFRYRRQSTEIIGHRIGGEDDYVRLNGNEGEESGSDRRQGTAGITQEQHNYPLTCCNTGNTAFVPQPREGKQRSIVAINAMNAYRGSRGKAPLCLNLVTRFSSVVRFTLRPLYPLERGPVLTEYEDGRTPQPAWKKERNLLPSSRVVK
jgi:hypothetical protein